MKIVDCLIIGAGAAALYSSLQISPSKKVLIATKSQLKNCNSSLAQGGIASVINEEDSFENHIEDTLTAGSFYNNKDQVDILVREGPSRIIELIKYGVDFDKSDNELMCTMEGGHSYNRILHAEGDRTGKVIHDMLEENVSNRSNIKILENAFAFDLIMIDGKCKGAKFFINNEIKYIYAKMTILATGGVGQLFMTSTNSEGSVGDGIALAYRVGAEIKDMEFIQFHPTVLYNESENQRFLISEALRGEGAVIRNSKGERFLIGKHKDAELAPRDIVARLIFDELQKSGEPCVYLDITHKDSEFIINRFPQITERCMKAGIDITNEWIPVKPAAHYTIGGVYVDSLGKTTISGLYACGETAFTGVHGANRLASNSLLECVVFAKRVGVAINKELEKTPDVNIFKIKETKKIAKGISIYEKYKYIYKIKNIMTKEFGIVRTEKGLLSAKKSIEDILDVIELKSSRTDMEIINMATVAKLMIDGALHRKTSLGCHYRIT